MNIYTHQVVSAKRGGKKKYRHDVELAEMKKQERKGRYQEEQEDEEEEQHHDSEQEVDE